MGIDRFLQYKSGPMAINNLYHAPRYRTDNIDVDTMLIHVHIAIIGGLTTVDILVIIIGVGGEIDN